MLRVCPTRIVPQAGSLQRLFSTLWCVHGVALECPQDTRLATVCTITVVLEDYSMKICPKDAERDTGGGFAGETR